MQAQLQGSRKVRDILAISVKPPRAASSAGRARRSQRRGRGFKSHAVHQPPRRLLKLRLQQHFRKGAGRQLYLLWGWSRRKEPLSSLWRASTVKWREMRARPAAVVELAVQEFGGWVAFPPGLLSCLQLSRADSAVSKMGRLLFAARGGFTEPSRREELPGHLHWGKCILADGLGSGQSPQS